MDNEVIKQTIKGLEENQEQAIKLLNENVELKEQVRELKERLNNASMLVRSRTYSIYDKKAKLQTTKVDITDKKLEELMRYLEK